MQLFTGWQYLLIDVANQYGHDKATFDVRISWATMNLYQLEALVEFAETKPLYMKAVQAIRKAQAGVPTGHLVGFDACCSGIQIMSALTGCVDGARATGLIDPDVRADAYSLVTEEMQHILGDVVNVSRSDAKAALMTSNYGSKAKPIEIFGEKTPELAAFYQAAHKVAPGAWDLRQDLLDAWRPFALLHEWKLPDGYDARVKVMEKKEARIEVDELDHATFSYEYYINEGTKKGLSLVANVTHSIDAYVLRCIHRRCNYDTATVLVAYEAVLDELKLRNSDLTEQMPREQDGSKLDYYISQYERSAMADVVMLPYIFDGYQTQYMSDAHLEALAAIMEGMLDYKPFEVITVHDEFKCHANHMNHLRLQYINVMAELAESNLLSDIFCQIHQCAGSYPKLTNNLGDLIRGSNYALS